MFSVSSAVSGIPGLSITSSLIKIGAIAPPTNKIVIIAYISVKVKIISPFKNYLVLSIAKAKAMAPRRPENQIINWNLLEIFPFASLK